MENSVPNILPTNGVQFISKIFPEKLLGAAESARLENHNEMKIVVMFNVKCRHTPNTRIIQT